MNKQKLLRLLPEDWNKRVFNETDFDRLCTCAGVRVLESRMPIDGAYCVYDRMPIIFINRELRGLRKLYVQIHELGHFYLHHPGVQFFLNTHSKVELEANIVAACALIPYPVLMSESFWESVDDLGYWQELIAFRIEVWRVWGI